MTRTALVIGCGGTIGGAWIVAALAALADATGTEPSRFDVLQGTSAGAEMVTMLGGGATVADLVAMHRERSDDPRLRRHLADTPSSLPSLPRPGVLAPGLVRSQSGLAALTGLAPVGRTDNSWLARLAASFTDDTGRLAHPDTRMVAFDVHAGRRVVLRTSRSDHPAADAAARVAVDADHLPASAADGVRASWAIPGWMPPVRVANRTLVDGGAASTASVDLVSPTDADLVYVVAPMASEPGVRAPGPGGIVENLTLRRPMSAGLADEVARARERGGRVVPILPSAADLRGLGAHFMLRSRRRSAFEVAMTTAPDTVRRALSASGADA